MRIRVLGDLQVTRRDKSVVHAAEWRTGKTRDLLRLLALADGRPLRSDQLTELLWPDVPSKQARNRLRTAVSQVRLTLADHSVLRHPDGYLLEDAVLDANQFTQLARRAAAAAAKGELSAVLPLARSAERLYRDDFRADDNDSEWAAVQRQELRQLRQRLACDAAEAALAQRSYRESLTFARLATELDPLSETAHRLLMRGYASIGETAAALRHFEEYRTLLVDELGVDPSPETRALHIQLLRAATAQSSVG